MPPLGYAALRAAAARSDRGIHIAMGCISATR
jgi:hypothetical protein